MSVTTTAAAVKTAYNFRKPILYSLLALMLIILAAIAAIGANEMEQQENAYFMQGNGISQAVLQWQPYIETELAKYGLEKHIYLVLAMMMQESGGTTSLDVMQSSESIGLPPNTITDPLYSIEIGVKHFASVMEKATKAGVDIETAIQSYNFGGGYIDFVAKRGGKHTAELAQEFSNIQAAKLGWSKYGDVEYVAHVTRYVGTKNEDGSYGNVATDFSGDVQTIMNEILKYEGFPYAFGGSNPSTSFDCSSLMQWGFRTIGINLPRTAQEQYNFSQKITKEELQVGDLVFFTRTYNAGRPVTHVGLYVGNGMMYDANSGGIGYSNLNDAYWQSHLYGYGRVANFNK